MNPKVVAVIAILGIAAVFIRPDKKHHQALAAMTVAALIAVLLAVFARGFFLMAVVGAVVFLTVLAAEFLGFLEPFGLSLGGGHGHDDHGHATGHDDHSHDASHGHGTAHAEHHEESATNADEHEEERREKPSPKKKAKTTPALVANPMSVGFHCERGKRPSEVHEVRLEGHAGPYEVDPGAPWVDAHLEGNVLKVRVTKAPQEVRTHSTNVKVNVQGQSLRIPVELVVEKPSAPRSPPPPPPPDPPKRTGKRHWTAVLGVSTSDDKDTVLAMYRTLAMRYHPDLNVGNPASHDKLAEVNVAWQEARKEKGWR